MASNVIQGLKKIDWKTTAENSITWMLSLAMVNAMACGLSEGNGVVWVGLLALLGALGWIYGSIQTGRADPWRYIQLCLAVAFALFFVVAPFLHVDSDKVWMAGEETTLSHKFLWRSPIAPFATSIDKKQDISLTVSGNTKDGTPVTASLSGKFRVSNDEKIVIAHFGAMKDPDVEVRAKLEKVLQHSFEQAVASMTTADIATAKSSFAIEYVVITTINVDKLGLKGSGPLVVSSIHPYFNK